MTQDPYSGGRPPNTPPRRQLWRIIVPVVLTSLAVLGVHLGINAASYSSGVDAIVASMAPTPSVYNTKLQKAVDADGLLLVRATRVLGEARYLSATPDYRALDNAVSDARTTLDLSGSFQLGTLSKERYVTVMADLERSFAQLQTAQKAIEADMAATPSPAPTPSPSPSP